MSGQLSKAINETETVNRRRCRGPVPPRRLRVLQVSKLFHPIFIFLFEKKRVPFLYGSLFFSSLFGGLAGWLAGWLVPYFSFSFVMKRRSSSPSNDPQLGISHVAAVDA